MRARTAIAIFVKTPGFSAVKTRLAAGIGTELSTEFYRLSAAAVASVVADFCKATNSSSQGSTPYWAVAEEEVCNTQLWPLFKHIWQGNGATLGHKLAQVYKILLETHEEVILLGADAPLLTLDHLKAAQQSVSDFSMGRSGDGGFYLFSGRKEIPEALWTDVLYSSNTTAENLAKKVRTLGSLAELQVLDDVDTLEDLQHLHRPLRESVSFTREQERLLQWAIALKATLAEQVFQEIRHEKLEK